MERLRPQSVLGVVVRAWRARPQAEAAVDPGKCSCLRRPPPPPPFSLSRARGVLGVVGGGAGTVPATRRGRGGSWEGELSEARGLVAVGL